jgi:hypothetical protein
MPKPRAHLFSMHFFQARLDPHGVYAAEDEQSICAPALAGSGAGAEVWCEGDLRLLEKGSLAVNPFQCLENVGEEFEEKLREDFDVEFCREAVETVHGRCLRHDGFLWRPSEVAWLFEARCA